MDEKNQQTSIQNLEPNIIAAFSYLIPPLTGIIFFLIEKQNKFVKFHAMQSILFGVVAYILMNVATNLRIIYIGFVLQPFITVGSFCVWLLLIWKAYQNEEYQLPFIGKIAKDQIDKTNTPKPEA